MGQGRDLSEAGRGQGPGGGRRTGRPLASLEEALEALRHLPETPETREQGIDVRLELRGSLYPLGEFEKMLAYLREAEAMASAISDEGRLGLVSIHTAEYLRQTGRFAEARTLAEKALAMGDKLQDVPLQSYAGQYFGLACHALGDYRRASETVANRHAVAAARRAGRARSAWSAPGTRIRRSPSPGSRAVSRSWGSSTRASTPAAGRWPWPKDSTSPTASRQPASGWGTSASSRETSTPHGPVLERACSVAREANLTLFRPQATRLLGGTYLLAGRIDEGVALVRAAADEVESRRLLMQQAAVLALLGEACLFADRVDEASTAAQRALTLARDRGQRGDAAAALYVLGEAAARGSLDIDKAERHYLAAIALAGELEMRPLLARSHLGIGRLYLRAGDRDRAEDHLLTATRLFIAMDMPLWLRQAASSLGELGRALIVARDRRKPLRVPEPRARVPTARFASSWMRPMVLGDRRRSVGSTSRECCSCTV